VSDIPEPQWLADVAPHDYEAAFNYLSLKLEGHEVKKAIEKFKKAKVVTRRANDILRAGSLQPAPLDDPGVEKDIGKLRDGKKLSPVLILEHQDCEDISDGYHRVSAAYHYSPYAEVPLKLVDLK
jgi:hypothetical protein